MRKYKWLLLALGALLLAGCSLARAEDGTAAGDRWIGFYVMRETGREQFYDNPYLTEYGSSTLETEKYGGFSIPRKVLMAVQEDQGYRFPGMEGGFTLFSVRREEEYGPSIEMVSNMGPGDMTAFTHVSDTGSEECISGTVYEGRPLNAADGGPDGDHLMWTGYRVYQTPAGEVYLDGSGNSYSGPCGFTETQTYTYTEDGGTVKEYKMTAKVTIEAVPRLEKLVVTQYDKNNAVLRTSEPDLEEAEVICEADAAWVLVEEVNEEGAVHTAYDMPDEAGETVYHDFAVLDDDGVGKPGQLRIITAA